MRTSAIVLASLLLTGLAANAKPLQGIEFQHADWEIYCSNTGTCQAAGYSDDTSDGLPASILLTRKAGPRQAVQVAFALGDGFDESLLASQLKNIHLFINQMDLGEVAIDSVEMPLLGELNQKQVDVLLQQTKQNVKIEFKNTDMYWLISDQGMTANLLKMDAFQKRIGTKAALVKKGPADESQVLAAQPKITIKKIKTAEQPYLTLQTTSKQYSRLYKTLMAAGPKQQGEIGFCEGLYEDGEPQPQQIALYKLTNNKVMATSLCWRGAYNEGYGVWVLDQSLTGKVQYVTESASEMGDGEINAAQKGRGIGDCWSVSQWIWNGQNFVQSIDQWTGKCRGLAAGGVWRLDKIEAVVQE